MSFEENIKGKIESLQALNNYRSLTAVEHQGRYVIKEGKKILNLASNDYLGLGTDDQLYQQFLSATSTDSWKLSATSSRLLAGNYTEHQELETLLAQIYGAESALVFNSGYHANIGILPAVTTRNSLILADKLVHASIIDGIQLSHAKAIRFRHNDYEQLEALLEKHHSEHDTIIIVTESLFSMDGDIADLPKLVSLKKKYAHVLLYVDEAHALGCVGAKGLGYAEQTNCLGDIDFVVGTFGKAMASMGAFVVCKSVVKEHLINHSRSFIFSTALPPVCAQWTTFVLKLLPEFAERREHLTRVSSQLQHALLKLGYVNKSNSHIIPILIGDNQATIELSDQLREKGFFVFPVRPPSVPKGTSRIRVSLTADIQSADIEQFISNLERL